MKATNCTQCGAVITDIRDGATFADCDYCGAHFLLPNEEKPVTGHRPAPAYASEPFTASSFTLPYGARIVLIAIGVGFLLLVAGATISIVQQKRQREAADAFRIKQEAAEKRAREKYVDPPVSPLWTGSTEPDKPLPVVNYQPRVSWDGPNDMQYFAEPAVDISSVSHLSSEEIKKTVFKNKIVKLRVVINTDGEIDQTETISGHPILVEAAIESAKRTIFRSRSKPTTRVLTYTFRVLKDD
jgi:predicted  nucleic acid-binding Zn-ribbon protein